MVCFFENFNDNLTLTMLIPNQTVSSFNDLFRKKEDNLLKCFLSQGPDKQALLHEGLVSVRICVDQKFYIYGWISK